IYHPRLHSSLVGDLRSLTGERAVAIAHRLGALIDGIYLRFACMPAAADAPNPASQVRDALDSEIGACR
ncbi:MAG: TetR family transcriptional regulator C-terminal domain-containing protein, partial [Hyphomicrobiaceae bacterium]